MAIISDALSSFTNVVNNMREDTSDMTEEELVEWDKKVIEANWKLVDSVCAFFGIPEKNVRREIKAVLDHARIAAENAGMTTRASIENALRQAVADASPVFMKPKTTKKGDKLYEAIISGDTVYADRLKSGYKDQSAAIRKALRENDSRIWEAAVAWNKNDLDTYMSLARGIVGEGYFTQDEVVLAIRAEANSMIEDDGGTTESKAKSYFTTEKFAVAVSQGNSAMADIIREDLILTHQKNGKSAADAEKSFNSSAKGELRELFETDKLSESEAVNALVNYTGMSREEAAEDVAEWGFKLEYGYTYSDRETAYKNGDISAYELREVLIEIGGKTPEEADLQIQVYDWEKEVPGVVDITAAAIKDYNDNCAAYGISKSAYYDAWTAYKDIDADIDQYGKTIKNSKVQKVMPYIDSLPLTAEQKTALAKCWWAESTVRKYKLW